MIVFLNRDDAGKVLPDRSHLDRKGMSPVSHLRHFTANGAQVFKHKIFYLDHHSHPPVLR